MKIDNTNSISKANFGWTLVMVYWVSLKNSILLNNNSYDRLKDYHSTLLHEQTDTVYTDDQKQNIQMVSKCMKILGRYNLWNPKCYNQALTSIHVLNYYNIPNQLTIGFKKVDNELKGHAWVMCGPAVITGYDQDLKSFSPLKKNS